MAWRRYLIALIALAGLAYGAWWAWTTFLQEPPAAGGQQGGFALPVDAAATRKDTVLRTVEAVGTLVANEQVTIRPEIAGIVTLINFTEGKEVERDAILFALDDTILQAELEQVKASLELSQSTYDRAAELLRRGSGTVAARDEALAQLTSDRQQLQLAEARLEKTVLDAPFTGVVGLRSVSLGDYVSVGEAMVTLSDLDTLKIDFRIPELFLAEVSVGQELNVRVDALPGETFTGEVFAIDPQVDVNGRALVIRASLDNPEGRLRPGLFARVDVVLERRPDSLLVPEAALVPTRDGQTVFRVVDGKVEIVPVTIGLRRDGEVEVTSGLAEGDVVVTGGQLKLRPGAEVMVPELSGQGQQPAAPAEGGEAEGGGAGGGGAENGGAAGGQGG